MNTNSQSPVTTTFAVPTFEATSSRGYTPKKADSRCRAWAKVVTLAELARLSPANVDSAHDVPGPFLPFGREIEVFPGHVIFEGEENHHAKRRGWTYNLGFVVGGEDGEARIAWVSGRERAAIKADMRTSKDPAIRALLAGSGEVSAMVRYARAVLAGFVIPSEEA